MTHKSGSMPLMKWQIATYSKIEHLFWLACRSFDALGLSQLRMVRLHHILAETVLICRRHSHGVCSRRVWCPGQPNCRLATIWIHTATAGDVWNICSALLNLRRAWQTSAVLSMAKFLLALWCFAAGGMLAETLAILLLCRRSASHLLLRKVAAKLIVTGQLLLLLFLIAIAIVWHAEVPILIFAKRCHVCTLSIIIHLTGVSCRRRTVAHRLVAVICLESLTLIVTIASSCLLFVRPHVFLRGSLLLSRCRICRSCNALLATWCFHRRCIVINWRVLLGLGPYTPACDTRLNLLLLGLG